MRADLRSAMKLEKLLCFVCGMGAFTAAWPAEVGEDKHSCWARAGSAVARYEVGCRRLAYKVIKRCWGYWCPMGRSWTRSRKVGDCSYVVFEQLGEGGGAGRADL